MLATFPLAAGVENSVLMFRLIFFMVILSMTVQGWLLKPAARWLGVAKTIRKEEEPPPLELEVTRSSEHQEMREYRIAEGDPMAGKTLAEISLPQGVLVTMLRRNDSFIPPRGDTLVEAGDGVLIMAEISLLDRVEKEYFPGRENH